MLLRAQGRAALPRGDTQIQPGELANRARQRGAAFPLFQLRQLAGLHRADGKMGGTTRCVVDEWELIRLNVVLGRQLGGCVPDERDPAYVLTIAERQCTSDVPIGSCKTSTAGSGMSALCPSPAAISSARRWIISASSSLDTLASFILPIPSLPLLHRP